MKGILVVLWTILLCIGMLMTSAAQTTDSPIKAWIDLELEDQEANIAALFINKSNQELTLFYELKVIRSGKSGTAKNQQNGHFTTVPEEQKILSKSSFYTRGKSYYKIVLSIYDEVNLVFSDSLIHGKDPNAPIVSNSPKITDQLSAAPTRQKKEIATASPKITSKQPEKKAPVDNLEIDGLIIDETRSKIGRDFYDLFYKKWIAPNSASNFSILIKELPSRGRGARISVAVNEQEVVQRFVPPRYDTIELIVNFSIRQTRSHLQQRESLKKELHSEDQQGSGIF